MGLGRKQNLKVLNEYEYGVDEYVKETMAIQYELYKLHISHE